MFNGCKSNKKNVFSCLFGIFFLILRLNIIYNVHAYAYEKEILFDNYSFVAISSNDGKGRHFRGR